MSLVGQEQQSPMTGSHDMTHGPEASRSGGEMAGQSLAQSVVVQGTAAGSGPGKDRSSAPSWDVCGVIPLGTAEGSLGVTEVGRC